MQKNFHHPIEIKGGFVKLMWNNIDFLSAVVFCKPTDGQVLFTLAKLAERNTNYCKVAGKKVQYSYLAKETGKSVPTIKRSVKRLAELNIIKIAQTPQGKQIVLNPKVIANGFTMPKGVLGLFEENYEG